MKKRILALLLMAVIVAALFAGLSVTAAAENDISGDTISGYVIAYTLTKDDTVLKVCNKLGIDFYKNQALITKINSIGDYSKLPVGKVIWLPATSVGSAKDYYILKSHKVVNGDNVNTLLTKYDISSTDTMLGRVNTNLANPTVGSTITFPVYKGSASAKMTDGTAAAVGTAAAAATGIAAGTATGTATGTAVTSGNVVYYLYAHTMQQGDTVGAICTANGINFNQNSALISRINGITNYNRIPVGRTILLPVGTATNAAYKVVAHQIQGGETANSICTSYGVSLANNLTLIKGLNNTNNLNYIQAGGLLYVPVANGGGGGGGGGGDTPTPTPGPSPSPTPSGNIYKLTKEAAEHGSFVLKIDGKEASQSVAGKTVTIVCNGEAEYAQKSIAVYMTGDPAKKVDVINNTFTVPEFHVTVKVTFEKANRYAIKCNPSTDGSYELYVDEKLVVDKTYEGAAVTIKGKPDKGYMIDKIDVYKTSDSDKKVPVTKNKFTMPGYDITVDITFKPSAGYKYPVYGAYAPLHGRFEMRVGAYAVTEAASGDTVDVVCTPNKGYKVDEINITYPIWNKDSDTVESKTVKVSNKQFKMPTFDDNIPVTDREVKVEVKFIKSATYSITIKTHSASGNTATAHANEVKGADLKGQAEVGRKVVVVPVLKNAAYQMDYYTVKYGSTTLTVSNPVNDASFTMPAADVTIIPHFAKVTPTLTFVSDPTGYGNGVFTVNAKPGVTEALPDRTVHIDATPDSSHPEVKLTSLKASYKFNGETINVPINSGNNFKMPPYDVTVTGKFEAFKYTVTMATNTNVDSIVYQVNSQDLADPAEVAAGDKVVIKPTMADGFVVKEIKVTYVEKGETKEVSVDSSYMFVMPKFDVTVTITEKDDPAFFAINIKNAEHGRIEVWNASNDPVTKAKKGDVLKVVGIADDGYELDSATVEVDGGSVTVDSDLKFTMPGRAVDVEAEFQLLSYNLNVDTYSGGLVVFKVGGTIVPSAHYNDTVQVTSTALSGYEFVSVKVYDASNNEIATITTTEGSFTMPNCEVRIVPTFHENVSYFEIIKKEITDGSGSFKVYVNGEEKDTAVEGNEIKVDAKPADGYIVSKITVNGTSIPVNDSVFTMPAADITIEVIFALK